MEVQTIAMKEKDLQDRHIPGISVKQISAIIGAVVGLALLYADIRNEIQTNRQETVLTRDLLKEMKQEYKEDRDFKRVESAAVRADLKMINDAQRLIDIRITILETTIKDK